VLPECWLAPHSAIRSRHPFPGWHLPRGFAPLQRCQSCESFSRCVVERVASQRLRAFAARRLSASGVSHPLDGFLLARPRRFVSPDWRSWGSLPSELFPPQQPCRLVGDLYPPGVRGARTVARVVRLQGLAPLRSPLASSDVSIGSGASMLSWGCLPSRALSLSGAAPISRRLLPRASRAAPSDAV
jgi:hypothetical protein